MADCGLLQMRLYRLPDGRKASAPQHSVDGIYERRAISVLEEATAQGVLPPLGKHAKSTVVDLRGIPPVVAEVHVLSLLASLIQPGGKKCGPVPLSLCLCRATG